MADPLTPAELDALLDILVHHGLYAEIERFKDSGAIKNYGPPFHIEAGALPSSPILQSLLSRFMLTLPGLRDVSAEFWRDRVYTLMEELGDAELSESYDRGSIGARRALSTAFAALLEAPSRGIMLGLPKEKSVDVEKIYDPTNADDLYDAFYTFLHELVHGDMIDQVVDVVEQSPWIEDHSSLVQTTHEFLLANLASFLHYITILSPDGQLIMKMMARAHRLFPYAVVRQTLKIGNAATMISAMVKLFLAKVSIGSITNWIGWSKGADEGMNLMQQIASTIIGWDLTALQKQATKIEKSADGLGRVLLHCIREHMDEVSRGERERRRQLSQATSRSIISTIITESTEATERDVERLKPEQHDRLLEYLDMQMGMSDRKEFSQIFCSRSPDLFTPSVRDVVSAFDPVIRAIHNAADLSASLGDFQAFATDFINLAYLQGGDDSERSSPSSTRSSSRNPWHRASPEPKPKDLAKAIANAGAESPPHPGQAGASPKSPSESSTTKPTPSVRDFMDLLRKHQHGLHKLLHQIAKNGPEVTSWYRDYAKKSAAQFKPAAAKRHVHIDRELQSMFAKLQGEERVQVRKDLDAHVVYLKKLREDTRTRLQEALDGREQGEQAGPGTYLVRWRNLLDSTLLTPLQATGPVRRGPEGVPVTEQESRNGTGEKGADMDDVDSSRVVADFAGQFAEVLEEWAKENMSW